MELKRFPAGFVNSFISLLIVPYGIETISGLLSISRAVNF